MAFNLHIIDTVIVNPTKKDFVNAIEILKKDTDNFIILENDIPIQSINFIQAIYIGENVFHTEVQYNEDNALPMYYNDNISEEKLLQLLLDFISNIAPDIIDWIYLCDMATYKYYSEYELRKILKDKGLIALKVTDTPQDKICLETSDIQVLLNYIKKNNINTIFYCYRQADERSYELPEYIDEDLRQLADAEIQSQIDFISGIDFNQTASLELFCINYNTIISMNVTAPWIKTLPTAKEFICQLREKYENDLNEIKTLRSINMEGVLEELKKELRDILIDDTNFQLCSNKNLRLNYIRNFLNKKENSKFNQVFLSAKSGGFMNYTQTLQNFADMAYALYKRGKN